MPRRKKMKNQKRKMNLSGQFQRALRNLLKVPKRKRNHQLKVKKVNHLHKVKSQNLKKMKRKLRMKRIRPKRKMNLVKHLIEIKVLKRERSNSKRSKNKKITK